jgi:hypothetical protein
MRNLPWQVAYIQSHVVRKPIANMLGLAGILESMDVPQDVKSILSMMTDSAKEVDKAIQTMANPL